MRVLATSVSLPDPAVPGWFIHLPAGTPDTHQVGERTLTDLVPNPAAWTDQAADVDDDPPPSATPVPVDGDPETPPAGQEPPRSGKGATTDAWRTYATALGVDPGDRGRDDIVALLLDQHLIDPEE